MQKTEGLAAVLKGVECAAQGGGTRLGGSWGRCVAIAQTKEGLMSPGRIGARVALVAVGVLVSALLMAAPSWAAGGTKLCIPTTENAPVKTPLKNGTCASTKKEKYTLTELGAEGKEGK